eukprot:1164192-Karenia_brevis.AAC.1
MIRNAGAEVLIHHRFRSDLVETYLQFCLRNRHLPYIASKFLDRDIVSMKDACDICAGDDSVVEQ